MQYSGSISPREIRRSEGVMKYWTDGRARGRNVILQVCLIDCIEILKYNINITQTISQRQKIQLSILYYPPLHYNAIQCPTQER